MSRTDYVWTVKMKDGTCYKVLSEKCIIEDFIHEMYMSGLDSFSTYPTIHGGKVAIRVSEVMSIEWS